MKNKKLINILVDIVIIVILIVLFIFIMGKIDFGKNEDSNDDLVKLKKVDDTKELVYDADYQLVVDDDSYTLNNGKVIKANEMIVPYINIDNVDGDMVNTEMYDLYKDLIDKFNKNLVDCNFYTIVDYEYYTSDDILSIVVYTESASLTVPMYQYYTYNFDLDTGELLNYTKFLHKLSLNRDDVDKLVSDILSKYTHNVCDGDKEGSNQHCNLDNFGYDTLYDISFMAYSDRVNEGSLDFYVNNNEIYVVLNPTNFTQDSGNNILFNVNTGNMIR